MSVGIGIDVGTTETKLAVVDAGGFVRRDSRRGTPPVETRDDGLVVFDPREILATVRLLLSEAASVIDGTNDAVRLGIACQAPSLCAWNETMAVGVSYLSSYGDPTQNARGDRRLKGMQRLESLGALCRGMNTSVSGLTGYLVNQLTATLTIDAITAWELGLESPDEVDAFFSGITSRPPALTPPAALAGEMNLNESVAVSVCAGTTDSGVLPLLFLPDPPDYYVYLGTWGCALQSAIRREADYDRESWPSELHKWPISLPDFVRVSEGPGLHEFFQELKRHLPRGAAVGICGGIARARSREVSSLAHTVMADYTVRLHTDVTTATGAARLALLHLDR